MIANVANKILFVFQFAYIIWPLFILTALAYSLQINRKRGWLRSTLRRIYDNLFYTWLVLFGIWLVTLFAETPLPTLIPEPANSIIFFGGLFLLTGVSVLRLKSLPGRLRARIDLHDAQAIAYFKDLPPDAFEELVAETYRALGNAAWRVGKSGDHGVDVEVRTPKGERWIVQCKRYRDSVGERVVRELYGALVSEGAERGVLVTSAEVTPPAEAWARDKPIDLVDGAGLLRLVDQARSKAQGSLFDRLAEWLRELSNPTHRPAGLRINHTASAAQSGGRGENTGNLAGTGSSQTSLSATQPVRIRSADPTSQQVHWQEIRPASFPNNCPRCGAPMAPHPARPERNLYRCSRYPDCRVVLEG